MKKRALPVIGVVLAVAFAVLAVPAFAGGNGGGSQNANAPAADHAPGSSGAPGKSADPPGQEKNGQQAPPPAAGSSGEHTAQGQTKKVDGPAAVHGQAKKTDSSSGVKPSNSTSHNVSAPAGSNVTKLYGNGQTAGQIAIANGASADAPLYGPGNSQPHKITACGQAAHGNGGGYDVHALKSHAKHADCTDTPAVNGKPTKDPAASRPGVATSPPAQTQPAGDAQTPVATPSNPGAAGATNGVLGAVASTTGATLPFTGLPLWLVVLVAIAATGAGLALRHQTRSLA